MVIKTSRKLFILSFASAILLWLSWPPLPFSFLIFVALVPLLIIESLAGEFNLSKWKYILLIYLPLLFWNVSTTYWIYNATLGGGILIHLVNPIILTLPFLILRFVKRRMGTSVGYFVFVVSWITIEYFHHSWQLAFPFMTLGNSLAMHPRWIQFYEYTGVLGGSLWILLVNFMIFRIIKIFSKQEITFSRKSRAVASVTVILFMPALISLATYISYKEVGKSLEVVVIHPNTDCRNEKYSIDTNGLVQKYLGLTFDKITPDTDYVIWPETAITDGGWVDQLNTNPVIKKVKDTLTIYPKSKLITGAIMYEMYHRSGNNEKPEDVPNLKYSKKSHAWYYTYNAALQLVQGDRRISMRTKQKLVPVEETIPYTNELGVLRKIISSLGGYLFTSRKLNNHLFISGNGYNATTLICYESIFGNLTADYVDKGANLLFIVLNEGWYKSTQGASQFMYIASLRAIENRRSIARSSNDGISCFINQRGEIYGATGEFTPTAIKGALVANRNKTFYTRFGDYLGVIASIFLVGISIIFFVRGSDHK